MNYTYEWPRCRLSHPSLPHTLSIRNGRNPINSECISCDGRDDRKVQFFGADRHYYCTHCDVAFHIDCYTYPRKTTHPYHLQHPLTLTLGNNGTEIQSDSTPSTPGSSSSDHGMSESNIILDKCNWCGEDLGEEFYHCSICSFSLDISCSKEDPLLTIPNPKSHHHSLFFLPRPLSVPCDACGFVDNSEPSYACFQCNYIVHLSCTYLPRVIKITRHPHRLFYTPNLPPANWLCRVCYKTIDFKYGQYSCNHEDCSYAVHSKCATHDRVWDKKELEWEPEILHDPKDIAPFVKVGDGLIKYFCHKHRLRLEKYDRVRDARKQCRACVLPIDSRDFYNCEKCYFCLHEVCAGLPRKLDHALHHHTLVLRPYTETSHHNMKCSTCSRRSTGFRYKCSKEKCSQNSDDNDDDSDDDHREENHYHIDLRCILVPEYFTHKSHAHPLFIAMTDDDKKIYCKVCKKKCKDYYLQCTKCEEFGMCYRCATIPHELDYKYDNHPLTLCYGENMDGTYWCEVCEKILDPTKWFYTCNKCCNTIHRECLFGASVYMKLGSTFYCDNKIVNVIACVGNTRPICEQCNNRCPDSVCYAIPFRGRKFWCSLKCVAKA